MDLNELKEQINYYTGKKIEVTENDLKKVDKFIQITINQYNNYNINHLIDIMRHEMYKYYNYNYNDSYRKLCEDLLKIEETCQKGQK